MTKQNLLMTRAMLIKDRPTLDAFISFCRSPKCRIFSTPEIFAAICKYNPKYISAVSLQYGDPREYIYSMCDID